MRKLKGQKGASYLLGLLAFLAATLVCAAILPAAMTGVTAGAADRTALQNRLTLNSAAGLVREMLCGQEENPSALGESLNAAAEQASLYNDIQTVEFTVDCTADGTELPTVQAEASIEDREDYWKAEITFRLEGENETVCLKEQRDKASGKWNKGKIISLADSGDEEA